MPRLRIDQMLNFNWKFLTPLALVLLILTAVVDKLFFMVIPGLNIMEAAVPWIRAGVHLALNLIIVLVTVQILKTHRIEAVRVVAKPRPVAVAPEPPASVNSYDGVFNMTPEQIIFLIVAAVTLVAGISVVTSRSLIHSALWLILALFGIAVFYVLLEAGFFAVIQVIIYIGAIAILFIFAAMLTRRELRDKGPQSNSYWWLGVIIALGFLAGIVVVLINWQGFATPAPELANASNRLSQLGQALVSPDQYVIPFELASVLLVAAMIGAIYVAGEKKQ